MTKLSTLQSVHSPRSSRPRELREALEDLAAEALERFGAECAVVRLYNRRTALFEARAFAGLSQDEVSELSNVDVSLADWETLLGLGGALKPRIFGGELPEASTVLGVVPRHESRFGQTPTLHVLPLVAEHEVLLGYVGLALRVETPEPDPQHLRRFGRTATLAVENMLLRGRVERQSWQLVAARRDMEQLSELKNNFIHSVSHELRTPVTSIMAYAEAMEAAIKGGDIATLESFLEVVRREGSRLTLTIDDVLDVSRLESGGGAQDWTDFDLIAVCHGAVRRMEKLFHEKPLQLHLEAPSGQLLIHADRGAVEQLLTNLLDNALKFTPAGGEVRLAVHGRGNHARIEVEDTGIGIPEHELDRVFDRFYQVDGSTTREHGGQGLGLAICREIAVGHGGRIWADPNVESGARFVLLIPRTASLARVRSSEGLDPRQRAPFDEFLQLVATLLAEITGTRVASVMLVDAEAKALRVEAAVGLAADVVHETRVKPGEGVAGQVWTTGRSILVEELGTDERFAGRKNHDVFPARSLLSVPLILNGQVRGVLNVNNKSDGSSLGVDDRLLLEGLGERIAQALDTFVDCRESHKKLSRIHEVFSAMLQVQHERWSATRAWVVQCAVETGRRLRLGESELRALAYVLRTYDMGLSRVGNSVLRKTGPLSPADRRRIDEHVHHSVELGLELEESSKVRQILYHHHENVDGSGYPDGLQGEAIPVVSRLLRQVDTLAALLHDRPSRTALSLDPALAFVRERLGAEFCPRVGSVFLEVLQERGGGLEKEITRPGGYESGDPGESMTPVAQGLGPQEEA